MFADISDTIEDNPARDYAGICVADVDGDGRVEFVVSVRGAPNRVLRWSHGRLRDIAPPELEAPEHFTLSFTAGDVDGDGREELYVRDDEEQPRSGGPVDRLFKRHFDGRWEDLLARPPHSGQPFGAGVVAIDRRGVGRYGFLVRHRDRPMQLLEQSADRSLANLARPLGLATPVCGRGVLALPTFFYRPDVICVDGKSSIVAFRNRDGSSFERVSMMGTPGGCGEPGRAVAAFDAGAGEFGLCWGNLDGPHSVAVREDERSWRDCASIGLAFPSAVRTIVAADFDNDGYEELFFHNLGEPNRLFRVAFPEGPIELAMLEPGQALDPGGFGTGAAACDIDGDGVLELLLARGEAGIQGLGLFKSRVAHGNSWLRVRPLTRFGASARGAVVRMESAGRIQTRGICGGSGLNQMEPVAHFGMGSNARAERVQVVWPDGAGVMLLNPGNNRTVTVPYPRG